MTMSYTNCSNKFEAFKFDSGDLGSTGDNNPVPVSGKIAMEWLTAKCAACHGPASGVVGGFSDVTNREGLVTQNQIKPGDPMGSILYQSLLGLNNLQVMPQGVPATMEEKNMIRDWIVAGAPGVTTAPPPPIPLAANYQSIFKNILEPKCVSCHNANLAEAGIRYDTYAQTILTVDKTTPTQSLLYTVVLSGEMPLAPLQPLSNQEVAIILKWIQDGALNN